MTICHRANSPLSTHFGAIASAMHIIPHRRTCEYRVLLLCCASLKIMAGASPSGSSSISHTPLGVWTAWGCGCALQSVERSVRFLMRTIPLTKCLLMLLAHVDLPLQLCAGWRICFVRCFCRIPHMRLCVRPNWVGQEPHYDGYAF